MRLQTKNLSTSQRMTRPQGSTVDQRSLVGQKRTLVAGQGSSASPRAGPNKTSARKDELLKELKAIEDAIARKRAKVE